MHDQYFENFCQEQRRLLRDFLGNEKSCIALMEGPHGVGKTECLYREALLAGMDIVHYSPAVANENSLLAYLVNILSMKGNIVRPSIKPPTTAIAKNRWRSLQREPEVLTSETARRQFSFRYLGQLHANLRSLLDARDTSGGKPLAIVVSAMRALRNPEFNYLSELFLSRLSSTEPRLGSKLIFIVDTDRTDATLISKLRTLSSQASGQKIVFSNLGFEDVERLLATSTSGFDQEILQKIYRFSGGNFKKLQAFVQSSDRKRGLVTYLGDAFRHLNALDPVARKMCATLAILAGNPECGRVWAALYPDAPRREIVRGLLNELGLLSANPYDYLIELDSVAMCLELVTSVEAKTLNDKIATAMLQLREEGTSFAWGVIAGHVDAGFGAHSPYLSRESRLRILFGALEEECYCANFSDARRYVQKILPLLTSHAEIVNKNLYADIYRLCAITSYMNADVAMMEKCVREYLALMSGDARATLEGYRVLVEGYIVNNRLDDAVEQIRYVLDKLNYQISAKSNPLRSALSVMAMLLGNTTDLNVEAFRHLGKRPESFDVGIFLIHLANVTYAKNDISLAAYAISVAIRFCLRNGLAEEASYVLQFWACCVMGGFFHNLEKARQISDLAFRMESESRRGAYSVRSRFVRNAFLGYHLDGLEENIRQLNEDFYNNFYEGDLPVASYAAHVCCFHAFDYNIPLHDLLRRIDVYADQLRCYPVQNPDAWIKVLRQIVVNLLNVESIGVDGEDFSFSRDLQAVRVRNNPALVLIAHHYCLAFYALTGNFEIADHVRETDRHVRHVMGTYGVLLSATMNAYVVFQRAQRGLCSMAEAQSYLKRAIKSLKRSYLQGSKVCYGKLQLLEALAAQLNGKEHWKSSLNASLQFSRENGNLMDALLALIVSMQFSLSGERMALRDQALELCRAWNAPRIARYIVQMSEDLAGTKSRVIDASAISVAAPMMH